MLFREILVADGRSLFGRTASSLIGDQFGWPIDSDKSVEVDVNDGSGSTRTAEIRVVETEWDGCPARLASLRDITERKRAERAMQFAQQSAETANEMKTRFLANMSHELRTPLNSIIGFSELISTENFGPVGNERYREYAGDIFRSGRHLLSLINDLLDLSKAEAGNYEFAEIEFDLIEAVHDAIRLVAPQAHARQLQLKTALAHPQCWVRGGQRQITQVVINLLSNAIKFTREGGQVELRVRSGNLGSIVVEVEDNGIGVDSLDIPKLFNAYTQLGDPYLREVQQGTGLGLSLCKRLVEPHGGFIRMTSAPDEGTRVSVVLPRDRVLGFDADYDRRESVFG